MKKVSIKLSTRADAGIENQGSFRGMFDSAKDSLEGALESTGESIKGGINSAKDRATVRVENARGSTIEKLAPVRTAGREQLHALKEEGRDIKKIFQSKELTFYKTEAFAIVLRKSGELPQFLVECDKLTKEGYRLMFSDHVETVFEIPVPGVHTLLGTFYYFQHIKYITR